MNTKIFAIILCICIGIVVNALSACSTFGQKKIESKAEFLKQYEQFMDSVQLDYPTYTSEKWQIQNTELQRLLTAQNQFADQLNYQERLTLGKFPILYHLCQYRLLVDEQVQNVYAVESRALVDNLTEIMDSTYTIFNGYDKNMRELLFQLKCDREEQDNQRKKR